MPSSSFQASFCRSFLLHLLVVVGLLSAVPLLLAREDGRASVRMPTDSQYSENLRAVASVTLGRTLFFDKRLSRDGSISCGSCHQPERAFTDGRTLAQGIGGHVGTRNTPSILNAALSTSQFWDGRSPSLESQALDPFINMREHGLANHDALLNILRHDPDYVKAFYEAFEVGPASIRKEHVGQAIASFERTLVAADSPFDHYYFKGAQSSLTRSAERGLRLFQGSAQCAKCHTIGKTEALFTDHQFHSLGIGLKRIEQGLAELTARVTRARAKGISADHMISSDEDVAELGRFAVTLKPGDIGKFRTPGLRNVALTAPYMHDGSVATLEEAVELEVYYRGAEMGRPLILTPLEKADLVEFLKSLTSSQATRFINPS